jgi:hypothetical protein
MHGTKIIKRRYQLLSVVGTDSTSTLRVFLQCQNFFFSLSFPSLCRTGRGFAYILCQGGVMGADSKRQGKAWPSLSILVPRSICMQV